MIQVCNFEIIFRFTIGNPDFTLTLDEVFEIVLPDRLLFWKTNQIAEIRKPSCGSMSNGNRVAEVTMIPFCVLNSSDGNPWRFHSPIVGASASISISLRLSVNGISCKVIFFCHPSISLERNS